MKLDTNTHAIPELVEGPAREVTVTLTLPRLDAFAVAIRKAHADRDRARYRAATLRVQLARVEHELKQVRAERDASRARIAELGRIVEGAAHLAAGAPEDPELELQGAEVLPCPAGLERQIPECRPAVANAPEADGDACAAFDVCHQKLREVAPGLVRLHERAARVEGL